ncbi:hypothetical protein ACE6H2_020337 [Prunus campanulata]
MKRQALTPPTALFFFFFFTTLLFYPTESTQPRYACDSSQPSTSSYPFCKTALPINQRVQDLVSRLTLDEKISQRVNSAPPIPRLGIPSYDWWSEALHGVADVGKGINLYGTISNATSFPQSLLDKSVTVRCHRHRARCHRRGHHLRFNIRSHLRPLAVVVTELAAIGGQHLQVFLFHLAIIL